MNSNILEKRYIEINASYTKRALAFIIDIIILQIILSPLKNPFSKEIADKNFSEIYSIVQSNNDIATALIINSFIIGILVIFYFSFMQYNIKKTIGMMIMNLKIKEKENTKNKKIINYIISNITFIPVFPFVILWIIDPIYLLLNKERQRLMQKIANILVVEEHEVL